jgi:hypothetical protein
MDQFCPICPPDSPGFLQIQEPVNHPANPYPWPIDAREPCPECNGARRAVWHASRRGANRMFSIRDKSAQPGTTAHDEDGYPTSWTQHRESPPHPMYRGGRPPPEPPYDHRFRETLRDLITALATSTRLPG